MSDSCFYSINGTTLTLPAKEDRLPEVIAFLKEDMLKHNIDPSVQFRVIGAAEEIFSNVADYAYPSNQNGMVDISADMQDDNVYMVTFIDSGQKYNPLERSDPDVCADLKDRRIGGLGVFLAKKLTDEIEYQYHDMRNILKIKVINKKEA